MLANNHFESTPSLGSFKRFHILFTIFPKLTLECDMVSRLKFILIKTIALFCLLPLSIYAHENHDGLRHWEIPSKDPDRIILTFHGNPATNRAVTWRTSTEIKEAVAQIAQAAVNSKFKNITTIKAKTEEFDLGLYKGNKSLKVNYHSVILKDLKPDIEYVYRVGDGQKRWSEWIQFRTAKANYAKTQFVYFGDAQNDVLSHWSRVIRKAYQTAPNATFAIHAGDLINTAHRDHEWAQWFKAGGFIHSQWTALPVPGNHEFQRLKGKGSPRQLSMQWKPQFTLPTEKSLPTKLQETVYTVEYQDIQIIALNSNELLEAQTAYLENQLKNSKAKWKIITCHHSVFSPAKGRNFQYARDHWKPLCDKYGVDLVLNGHDHTYARGHVPIRNADGKDTGNLGTVYVTSVSGPKQYSLDPKQIKSYASDGYQNDKSAEQTQFFQVITIENNTLSYVAYTALGNEYDRAVITKNFKTGKKKLSTGK